MNTSQCNKIDKILNYGLSTAESTPRAHLMNVSYIDPGHVLLATVYPVTTPDTVGVEIAKHTFIGREEATINDSVVTWMKINTKSVFINRKKLLALLNAMDCNNVRIRTDENAPLMVTGLMDHDLWVEGIIAPMIPGDNFDDKTEIYYEN